MTLHHPSSGLLSTSPHGRKILSADDQAGFSADHIKSTEPQENF
jgi:hypothetical protein